MPILHRTQSLSALMPRFVERFRCIGASCEDTCCSGWTVYVDKKTYKAYRKESVPALGRMMANMTRLDGGGEDAYGAITAVGQEQRCPALQDGMCSVQTHLGESYLSDTCHTYPLRAVAPGSCRAMQYRRRAAAARHPGVDGAAALPAFPACARLYQARQRFPV